MFFETPGSPRRLSLDPGSSRPSPSQRPGDEPGARLTTTSPRRPMPQDERTPDVIDGARFLGLSQKDGMREPRRRPASSAYAQGLSRMSRQPCTHATTAPVRRRAGAGS